MADVDALGNALGRALARDAARLPEAPPRRDADLEALEQRVAAALGLRVSIVDNIDPCVVMIEWATLDQLDMLVQRLTGGRV